MLWVTVLIGVCGVLPTSAANLSGIVVHYLDATARRAVYVPGSLQVVDAFGKATDHVDVARAGTLQIATGRLSLLADSESIAGLKATAIQVFGPTAEIMELPTNRFFLRLLSPDGSVAVLEGERIKMLPFQIVMPDATPQDIIATAVISWVYRFSVGSGKITFDWQSVSRELQRRIQVNGFLSSEAVMDATRSVMEMGWARLDLGSPGSEAWTVDLAREVISSHIVRSMLVLDPPALTIDRSPLTRPSLVYRLRESSVIGTLAVTVDLAAAATVERAAVVTRTIKMPR